MYATHAQAIVCFALKWFLPPWVCASSLENLRNMSTCSFPLADGSSLLHLQDQPDTLAVQLESEDALLPATLCHIVICILIVIEDSGWAAGTAISPRGPGHGPASQNQEINRQVRSCWDCVGLEVWAGGCRNFDVHRERRSWGPGAPVLSPSLTGATESWVLLAESDVVVRLPISPLACPRPRMPPSESPSFWASYRSLLPGEMAAGEDGQDVSGIFMI